MKILVFGDFQGVFPLKSKRKLKNEDFDLVIGVGDYGGIRDFRSYLMKFFKLIKEKETYLSAEDYFGKKRYRKLLKKDEEATKNVLKELNKIGKPGLLIFGNSDDGWYDYLFDNKILKAKKSRVNFVNKLRNIKEFNYKNIRFKGVNFLGFGGYMEPVVNFISDDKATHKKRKERMDKANKKLIYLFKKMNRKDIAVFHYPPEGIFDIIREKRNPFHGKSAGVTIFRKAVLKYKPRLVLCGHMHEYQGAKKLGKSLIVNPGDAEKGKYAIIEWPLLKVKFAK